MNISIIGTGYVGLVSGACFAELGNRVICADNDAAKINGLKRGIIPIYEPGLKELTAKNVKKNKLSFTSMIKEAVRSSDVIFIAVGTPAAESGEADLTGIENVARSIAFNMDTYKLVVEKSTVPVETGLWVKRTISTYIRKRVKFDVASNPEFLREGSAIHDFMHPDRVVIGAESKLAADILSRLYKPLKCRIVVTDINSAELIKHASNSFLATKISFINAVAQICDKVGADVTEVAHGMGLDKRIGAGFLNAGIGYGGSCFPKDLDAFIHLSDKIGYDFKLLKSVREINNRQQYFLLHKLKESLWVLKDKQIGILGLSFKPDTDDIRNAPSISIINSLREEGAQIKIYDPSASKKARHLLKEVKFCADAYSVARQSDCLLILTEWEEFKRLDFVKLKKLLRRPLIVDGRNMLAPEWMRKLGFTYISIGRPAVSKK